MLGILEKNIILMASLLVMIISYGKNYVAMEVAVFYFLISVILTELGIYVENKKMKLGILAVFIVICILQWKFIFFLPVIFFFLIEERCYYGFLLSLLYFILYMNTESFEIIFAELLLCAFAVLLSYENGQSQRYRKMYLKTRDSSTELENILKRKNKELIESQDQSISNATLKERNRIAREIHDNVGHMLSRTILQTGALMTIYKEEPLHGQIQSINNSLSEAMNNIRESVHDLHDESVDLKLSVIEILTPIKDRYVIDFDYDMSDGVSRNVKYSFIAILKEATSNIVKHSDASKIYILMREHPGFYQLAIEDNGKGNIDIAHAGIGLTNMTDRVEALLGNITFSNNNGFKILISIPKSNENK